MAEATLLARLEDRRKALVEEWENMITQRETEREQFEARQASDDDQPSEEDVETFRSAETAFKADSDAKKDEIRSLDGRIGDQGELDERREQAAKASRGTTVAITSEPMTYRKDNQREFGYFRDLASRYHATFASKFDDLAGAHARLERHAQEIEVELPKREAARERRAQEQIERAEIEFRGSFVGGHKRGLDASPFERRVNPNRTDGQGGYLVPPLWLMDETIPALRAGRPAAGLCRNLDVPAGTDSINIPKISTATLTGVQSADAAGVTSQDFTDTTVTAGVKTIAGQEDVSIQLLEQSPSGLVDRVIMEDLYADYNMQIDRQVLLGTGVSGQITGILPVGNWSGANTVTWTTSSPLGVQFNRALGAAASKTSYNRYDLTNLHFVGHPRRWFWFATEVDGASGTSGRPLVNTENVAYNVSALENDPAPFEGLAGRVPFGPNFYIDGNVPAVATAAGAISSGTNDLVIAAKWDDCWLFEDAVRTRVLPEILSGTLQVRFQLYNYFAFLVRYGQSISVILGTGLAAPTAPGDTSITF